ncbi:MAG: DNA repair protein RadA [Ruminococcaceae bacterium]|nr:DNA repair protein RadA [Oscillospiraceae bacterium]
MAGKIKVSYVCNSCGYESVKWMGKCAACGEWNTMEEIVRETVAAKQNSGAITVKAQSVKDISVSDEPRYLTNIPELDRVLGGGIVKGSIVLLSGDPGIGKSTILLQIADKVQKGLKILYVSGEESAGQIKIRAQRLNVDNENLLIMTETDVEAICDYINAEKPDIVMIDSIQTMQIAGVSSTAGSVVQVRESTNLFLKTGKKNNIPIIIVGHVNKGGEIAGPKITEHIVDAVLYFEGERNQSYRILRAVKNRFGSTNEIGVFEMGDKGLAEVPNPSAMLLSGKLDGVSGSCITCVIEGTRPILAEVQGLVTSTGFGNPRRASTGFDYNRLNLILAVLEKRIGLYFSNFDTYLNVVGGLRLDEPAADLAVALSLVSGLRDIPIDSKTIAIGEIGLSGEIRSVSRIATRVSEAARLGFTKCIIPKASLKQITGEIKGIELIPVKTLGEAIEYVK